VEPQYLVSIATSLSAAVLALIPVYQKWREIKRNEDVVDKEKGVDSFGKDVKEAFRATFNSKDSLLIVSLSILILGGLIHNTFRAAAAAEVINRHFEEFQQVKNIVNQRFEMEKTNYKEIQEILKRVEIELIKRRAELDQERRK